MTLKDIQRALEASKSPPDVTLEDIINHRLAEILHEEAEAEARAERAARIRLANAPATAILARQVVRTKPTDKTQVARAHAAIAAVYRYNTGPGRRRYLNRLAVIRIQELERYLAHRYGREIPCDDAGIEDLTILLNHVAQNRADQHDKVRRTIRTWSPRMSPDIVDDLVARVTKKARRYRAATVGKLTRLTEEEHALLGITSWWPHTWDEAEVRAEQRQRKQARDRNGDTARRRAAGAVTRDEYLAAHSTSRDEPWKALGIHKRTWERRRRKAAVETGDCRKSFASISIDPYRSEGLAARKSLTPWAALGMSKPTYYRRKKAGTLPRPILVKTFGPIRTSTIEVQDIEIHIGDIGGMTELRVTDCSDGPSVGAPQASPHGTASVKSSSYGGRDNDIDLPLIQRATIHRDERQGCKNGSKMRRPALCPVAPEVSPYNVPRERSAGPPPHTYAPARRFFHSLPRACGAIPRLEPRAPRHCAAAQCRSPCLTDHARVEVRLSDSNSPMTTRADRREANRAMSAKLRAAYEQLPRDTRDLVVRSFKEELGRNPEMRWERYLEAILPMVAPFITEAS